MLIGIINFYHFIPLSVILAGGHISLSFLSDLMNFCVVLKEFKWNILILLFCEIYRLKGNDCCFTDCPHPHTRTHTQTHTHTHTHTNTHTEWSQPAFIYLSYFLSLSFHLHIVHSITSVFISPYRLESPCSATNCHTSVLFTGDDYQSMFAGLFGASFRATTHISLHTAQERLVDRPSILDLHPLHPQWCGAIDTVTNQSLVK